MVFRDRRPSRHRAAEGKQPEAVPDHELESFLASISSRGDGSTSEPGNGYNPAALLQLRLPELRAEQLRRLAEAHGVSPTALVMDWVLDRLDAADAAEAEAQGRSSVAPAPRREDESVPASPTDPATTAVPAADLAPTSGRATTSDPAATAELVGMAHLTNTPYPEPHYLSGDQPATASLVERPGREPVAPLSPVDQLNPVGELAPVAPVGPAAPVTPLFRNTPGAHATEEKSKGPRHRAPEPVTSLHTRRRF